jgi:molybdopterin-guanine dinucleotide biosynthesis protein B
MGLMAVSFEYSLKFPRLVAVVGGKHSGKTTIIENIISELKKRGYHVGAIKEMVRIPTLDVPEKETARISQSGAEIVVALPRDETVVFIKRRLELKEILPFFAGLDFVIIEGFESEKLPKIIAAKDEEEVKEFLDEDVFAVSGLLSASGTGKVGKLQIINCLKNAGKLADIVEEKASKP